VMTTETKHEIILERARYGRVVRVTALDVLTGTEVVFQAPSYATSTDLRKIAIDKLTYILRQKKS